MNKRVLIFAILFFLSALQACEIPVCQTSIKTNDKKTNALLLKLWRSYITSLVLSGTIGGITGGLTRYLEKQVKPGLVLGICIWLVESRIRYESIVALQSDLDIYDIGHKKNLMFECAWIASWLTYFHV